MSLAQRCDRIIELLDGKIVLDQATPPAVVAQVTQTGEVVNE